MQTLKATILHSPEAPPGLSCTYQPQEAARAAF
jgi:hypothetical protein